MTARTEPPLDASLLVEHPLDASHISGGLVLSHAAGWNQLDADWRQFLSMGHGWGMSAGDELVATTMVMPYGGPFDWVSVVLVARAWRRQGLARRLTLRANEALDRRARTAILDATPAGRHVYLQLGYVDCWPLERLTLATRPASIVLPAASNVKVRAMTSQDLPAVAVYDHPVFGADRSALLAHLRTRLAGAALVAESEGAMRGFMLGRDGRLANFLGPISAESPAIALALLRQALHDVPMPWTIDLPAVQSEVRAALIALGFTASRPFWRMARAPAGGVARTFEDSPRLIASAGPEFG
ncbi:MAG: GNAT family N-acetyltransferase [Burkholderiales bacterium]